MTLWKVHSSLCEAHSHPPTAGPNVPAAIDDRAYAKGMYKTSRNNAGGITLMICNDCGHAVSLNKLCEKPLQSATDMLKHMAAHNASRAFAPIGLPMETKAKIISMNELTSPLPADPNSWLSQVLQSPN
jgi:hypothetical protein